MTKMKQMLVLLLTLVVVLTSSVMVNAKDTDDVISKVSSLGIMIGTNKGFEEEKTLTRAEATAIMVRMAGYTEEDINKFDAETKFDDVQSNHWGIKYINAASSLNLVYGIGDNKFAPDNEVTIAEVVAMAVRSLGADAYVAPLGEWPTNYMNFAKEEDIISKVNGTKIATRKETATIIANTLEVKMWKKTLVDSTGKVTYEKGNKTLLEEVFEVETLTEVEVKDINKVKETIKLDENTYDYACSIKDIVKGAIVDAWVKDDKIIRITLNDKNEFVAFDGIVKKDTKEKEITLIVNDKEITYDYKKDITGTITTSGTAKIKDGKIVEYIDVKDFDLKVVKRITSKRISFTDGTSIEIDEDKNFISIDTKELSEEDVILYNKKGNEYTIKMVEVVTGKISSIGKDYIKIANVKYDLELMDGVSAPTLKTKITAYVYNGKIISFEDAKMSTDFALITDKELIDDDDFEVIYTVILANGSVKELKYKKDVLAINEFYQLDVENNEITKKNHLELELIEGKATDLTAKIIEVNEINYSLHKDCFAINKDLEKQDIEDIELYEDTVILYILDKEVICIEY